MTYVYTRHSEILTGAIGAYVFSRIKNNPRLLVLHDFHNFWRYSKSNYFPIPNDYGSDKIPLYVAKFKLYNMYLKKKKLKSLVIIHMSSVI